MQRYLIMKDGTVFTGTAIGANGTAIGEAVFTTAMSGYIPTLTDPSYYGQIITHTFPMIGNYGAIEVDAESDKPYLFGYIVRELCSFGSNFRKEEELDEFLKRNNVVGIADVDTRAITRKIRDMGVMNAMICDDLKDMPAKLALLKKYKVKDAVEHTSCTEPVELNPIDDTHKFRVVLYDFGAKKNIERMLIKFGCSVVRVPYNTTAEQALKFNPDGIMLSNGGGDPADNVAVIEEIKKLLKKNIPIFGICLGHQLLALAMGAKTIKLKYGHRGANQPVKDLTTGKTYITSQNHGYAVKADTLSPEVGTVRYINANDKTVEGIEYKTVPAFSVQFHPEACGGPKDTEFLFKQFVAMMEENHA
ncbi:MAG: glutamine-hydrolyzing carbamoyl-phosphate synthase small subunit [Clostridiales bacterium]|nr:glutamine-hydrolyzing carbamoyl-phosphate synthase small subunit [Clostridiales bacterium]